MARAALTLTTVPAIGSNGLNLTDASFTVMSTGAGNGVSFTHDQNDLVVLKNTTGGNAIYTLQCPTPASISAVNATVTAPTVTVATTKTHVLRLSTAFRQSDGKAYIDCDVAGSIIVVDL